MKIKSTSCKNLISILSVLFVAIIGSVFVNLGKDWFNGLSKPIQWLPEIIIPIVWSIIYTLAGIILFLLNKNNKNDLPTSIVFIINGLLNVLWCLIFFTLHLTFLGLVIIILNLIMGFYLIYLLYNFDKKYGYALVIYPIWLSIATALNLALWILN